MRVNRLVPVLFIVVVAIICGLLLCSPKQTNVFVKNTKYENVNLDDICNMKYLGNNLMVDETTGILYYTDLSSHFMTVIMDKDGLPKNILNYINEVK